MSFFAKLAGWFFGGGKTAEKVTDIADKAFHTEQEKTETDQRDLSDARAMTAPSHGSWFDVLVDGFNRLVRPGITLWFVGGFVGWWALPDPDTIGEFWQNMFVLVITFWFGGRAILKDLPAAIKSMRGK